EVASVEPLGYDAAEQRLEAVLRDPSGTGTLLRAEHDPACPGRLDALAEALDGGQVRYVSGLLTRRHGRPVLDPLAVLTPEGPVVPDLAADAGTGALAPTADARTATDPITTALETGLAALAEILHTGLRACGPTARDRLASAAAQLRRTGLTGGAALLESLAGALADGPAAGAVTAWADAAIHLLVALEQHQEHDSGL
ncbi:hypothetical protein AB0O00_03630, partial [Kitasatospora sp. NPDC093558]